MHFTVPILPSVQVMVTRQIANRTSQVEATKIGPLSLRQAIDYNWLAVDDDSVKVTISMADGDYAGNPILHLDGRWSIYLGDIEYIRADCGPEPDQIRSMEIA